MSNDRGAGRKPLPKDKKMVNKTIRFPPDMITWIKEHGDERVRELIKIEMQKGG
jgi:hypothetical protein